MQGISFNNFNILECNKNVKIFQHGTQLEKTLLLLKVNLQGKICFELSSLGAKVGQEIVHIDYE